MPDIHSTAIVDPSAELGDRVSVGPHTIIDAGVQIGDGTTVASHCLVASGVTIGRDCRIHHGAVVGSIPQDLKFAGEETTLSVGDRTTIREFCTLNRGTVESGTTSVGSDCLLMAYVHVAHDCQLGDHVILANLVQLGGHVHIGDYAIIGGGSVVHQFEHIGKHAMVGGGFRITKDVPPYALAGHEPLRFEGLNRIGLRRRGFSAETIEALQRAYEIIYDSGLNVSQGVERIKEEMNLIPEIQDLLDFIAGSKRGIIPPVRS